MYDENEKCPIVRKEQYELIGDFEKNKCFSRNYYARVCVRVCECVYACVRVYMRVCERASACKSI